MAIYLLRTIKFEECTVYADMDGRKGWDGSGVCEKL